MAVARHVTDDGAVARTSQQSVDAGSSSEPPAPRSRVRLLAGAFAAFLVGGLVTVQSMINGRLAEYVGGGFAGGSQAALVSFGTGLAIVTLASLLVPRGRRGIAAVRRALGRGVLRPWQVLGGSAGAFLVINQGLTVPTIGVALFAVAVVAGQSVSGLVVDRAGLGPAGRRPITAGRAVGATLAIVAVGLTVVQRLEGTQRLAGVALLLALLPLLAGAGTSWQQAVNGRVAVVGGPLAATWINFAVGTGLLFLVWLGVQLAGAGADTLPSPLSGDAWLYLGGSMGVLFIGLAAVLVRTLGVLILGLCTIAGQVVVALGLDAVTGRADVGPLTITGAVLTLVGVVVAALSTRRPNRARKST